MSKRISTIILSIVLVFAVGLCVYAFLLRDSSTDDSDSPVLSGVSVVFVSDGNEVSKLSLTGTNAFVLKEKPEKTGYDFEGWYLDKDFGGEEYNVGDVINLDEVEGAGNAGRLKLYAKWKACQDTAYTVNEYFENETLSGYILSRAHTLTGETDSGVEIEPADYDGFEYNDMLSVKSGRISADGSLRLNIYYRRIRFDINFVTSDGRNLSAGAAYGAKIAKLPVPEKAGYIFKGWFLDENRTQKIVDGDTYIWNDSVTLYADWEAAKDTKYQIKYYFQNVNLDGYVCDADLTEIKRGETGMPVNAYIKNFTGFLFNFDKSVQSGYIEADGGSVLKLYYNRESYTVLLESEHTEPESPYFNVYYQQPYELENFSDLPYYNFDGWYYGGQKIKQSGGAWNYTDSTMTLVAKWNPLIAVKNGLLSLTEQGLEKSGIFEIPEVFEGEEIKGIAENGFAGAKYLTAVVFGKNIIYIGGGAFSDCQYINNLYFKSDYGAWSDIVIDDGERKLPNVCFYSENDPDAEGNFWHYDNAGNIEKWIYKVSVYFVVEGTVIEDWTITERPGSVIAAVSGDGAECGKTGFFVNRWYDNSNMLFETPLPAYMPSEDAYFYGTWDYSLVGEGFEPYAEKFYGKHNSSSYAVTVKSHDELVALVEYVLFYNLNESHKIWFTLSYFDGNASEFAVETENATDEHTYANWRVASGKEVHNILGVPKYYGYFYAYQNYRSSAATRVSEGDNYKQLKTVSYTGAAGGRSADFNDFSIDKVAKTLSVTTSDQLVYALEHGLRPVPSITSSPAAKMYGIAKEILREIINDNMSQTEKLFAIYNWLVLNVDYDYGALNSKISWQENQAWYLEGVFLNGHAVCDAIAKAAVVLARIEGIVAVRTVSKNHAWNKVYIDADSNGVYEWYDFDATWGNKSAARGDDVVYEYANYIDFLNTDEYKKNKNQQAENYNDFDAGTEFNVYEFMTFEYEGNTYDYVIASREEFVVLFAYAATLKSVLGGDEYISLSFIFDYQFENLTWEINYAKAGTSFVLVGGVIYDAYNECETVCTLILDSY